MVGKSVLTLAVLGSSALSAAGKEMAYGAPEAAAVNPYYDAYAAPKGYPQANPYGQKGYYKTHFLKPRPVMDPKYYQVILEGFDTCVQTTCGHPSNGYTTEGVQALELLGEYTACVTSCAASEAMRVVSDFKNIYSKLYDIGCAQLEAARKYLAGEGEYDVLEERTRIDDSCCLPNDYFVDWNRIVMWVEYEGYVTLATPVKDYLDYCSSDNPSELYLGKLRMMCDPAWVCYLQELQRNTGHLVLAPKCDHLAPNGACDKNLVNNPRASEFPSDMCVAYECYENGKKTHVSIPLLKNVVAAQNYGESCPDDISGYATIKYKRIPKSKLNTYTIVGGLPSDNSYGCDYGFGLMTNAFAPVSPPDSDALSAVETCPESGNFEYCNMKQYVNFLQQELFDLGACPIHYLESEGLSDGSYTLACLFRVITLKCDCMEAVLNCYEKEYEFSTALGKTIGKASSIMCGFILCQRESVFTLFGGESAIHNANLMKEVLMQVGAIAPSVSSLAPATMAFLSFGLGMVAFLVTKKAVKMTKNTVSVEGGYSNLI